MPCEEVPEIERNIGMEVYLTDYPGFGGRLRTRPEDFIVDELSYDLPRVDNGPFIALRIRTKNWETFRLFDRIARKLGLRASQIHFAGTKDKRAITTQLIVIPTKRKLENVVEVVKTIKNVEVLEAFRTNRLIKLGDLYGNRFTVTIRDVSENAEELFYKNKEQLDTYGGFPNFYGVQRFGSVRPISHIVGKLLLMGKFEEAFLTLVAKPYGGEAPDVLEVRKYLLETRDYEEAYRMMPRRMVFDKRMLEHLVRHPGDFIGAFRSLPKPLRIIYIYAYQSYLFNKILSERIRRGLPIMEPVEGDIIIPLVRPITLEMSHGIYVDRWNIDKIRKKVREGKAFVTGLVPGTKALIAKGEPGEIEMKILQDEGINPKDFVVPNMPELTSEGTRRALGVPVKWIFWKFKENTAVLSFELYKGCYATSLLREFMKAKDIKAYA
ncbi:MAG: tRNA pseudouridine(13) synthase TruD [Thermoplasmata archaeon]|nr:MAG: tRNA pseudouridine(13) synthase TruD [Thermoplasmata archaeon]